jgi:PBP superfamily domain
MMCVALASMDAPYALAGDFSGAGASFPYPIYAKWAESYKKETGNGLTYQSIGSTGGVAKITARTVTFGASDIPLTAQELAGGELVQWPMVMGGIVPIIDLSRRDQDLGSRGFKKAQSEDRASFDGHCGRVPLRRVGDNLPLYGLPVEDQRGVEIKRWIDGVRQMACRYRREGQSGCRS